MTIQSVQRLTSNTTSVFLGSDREQAAMNAANGTGGHPIAVPRYLNPTWPLLEKFENDESEQPFSPFGGIPNPKYIWDQPITTEGQTAAFAIASAPLTISRHESSSFCIFFVAFADNAMDARIQIFEDKGDGTFVKATFQPSELDEFLLVSGNPNTPAVGLTETESYNWQNIRAYSTRFTSPILSTLQIVKIVVSFEVTNYLIQPPGSPNPAGLQFMVDIYREVG